MNKILFICGVFPHNRKNEIINRSKYYDQEAAENYQNAILNGLSKNEVNFDFLTAPFIGAWPKFYKDIVYKSHNPYEVSFFNCWGLRNISRYLHLLKRLKKMDLKEYNSIIIYSVHTPFVKLAKYIKRKYPKVKVGLFVPDLPEFMNLRSDKSFLYKLLKKIDVRAFYHSNSFMDYYVFLTESMNSKINFDSKPHVVIEGFIDEKKICKKYVPQPENHIKKIVYTGLLNEKFGISDLIQAFQEIDDPNINLCFYGSGDYQQKIIEIGKEDSRIKYFGQVSNDEIISIQRNADILINPRKSNEEYAMYSFPSKTMEYLASGRPVIAYMLPGIPSEYQKHLFVPQDSTTESFARTMKMVLSIPSLELKTVFDSNTLFISNKTSEKGVKKILGFIHSLGD